MTRSMYGGMGSYLFFLFLLLPSAAAAQDGADLYRQNCAGCHDAGVDRAPARDALQTMTADRVLAAMESGAMISMASRLVGAERRAVAQFVTGKTLVTDVPVTPRAQAMCGSGRATATADLLKAPLWNAWGDNTANTRFQADTALTSANVPRLKVKWAFGFPGDLD